MVASYRFNRNRGLSKAIGDNVKRFEFRELFNKYLFWYVKHDNKRCVMKPPISYNIEIMLTISLALI